MNVLDVPLQGHLVEIFVAVWALFPGVPVLLAGCLRGVGEAAELPDPVVRYVHGRQILRFVIVEPALGLIVIDLILLVSYREGHYPRGTVARS